MLAWISFLVGLGTHRSGNTLGPLTQCLTVYHNRQEALQIVDPCEPGRCGGALCLEDIRKAYPASASKPAILSAMGRRSTLCAS